MPPANLNTPDYWDRVYREECESGKADGNDYSRDYGPIHDAVIATPAPKANARAIGYPGG